MTNPRILIAGVGNIFLGDDAFGCEVAQRLLSRAMPPHVRVVDFGIRGLDLTYAMLEDCDIAIIVDAVPRGEPPGTLYVIEPDAPTETGAPPDLQPGEMLVETHGMDPAKVFRLVRAMGSSVRRILVVGCEPAPFDPEVDMDMSLSPLVRAAVDEAVPLIESLLNRVLEEDQIPSVPLSAGILAGASSKGANPHDGDTTP